MPPIPMPTAVNRHDERKHRHAAIDTGVQRSCQRLTAAQPELHPSRRPLPPSHEDEVSVRPRERAGPSGECGADN
jgi:hypothetical protein